MLCKLRGESAYSIEEVASSSLRTRYTRTGKRALGVKAFFDRRLLNQAHGHETNAIRFSDGNLYERSAILRWLPSKDLLHLSGWEQTLQTFLVENDVLRRLSIKNWGYFASRASIAHRQFVLAQRTELLAAERGRREES